MICINIKLVNAIIVIYGNIPSKKQSTHFGTTKMNSSYRYEICQLFILFQFTFIKDNYISFTELSTSNGGVIEDGFDQKMDSENITEGNILMEETNSTKLLEWEISYEAQIISAVYLSTGMFIGLITNTLLILVICLSPTLRTPPNYHLVNISFNNLLLSICMIFSTLSVFGVQDHDDNFFVAIQLFITQHCTTQYFATFASIGIYRNITLSKPTLSLRIRKRIVRRSISISWFLTCLLSLIFTITFMDKDSLLCITLTPFQKSFVICQESDYLPEPGKICMAVIICFFYVVALISTLSSYYTISKELNIIKPKTSNKILPISRAMSLSSEDTCDPQNHYQIEPNIPSQNGSLQVYTIQCADSEETVVHYQKNENMVTFEEVFALQNPILAQSMANSKRPLQATLSNASTQSRTSRIDFTDISPNADLQRFQMMKNNSALRNQTLRRDRISVRSATKNSFIMFTGYLLSSLPLIICSVPYATARSESIATRVYIFLFLKFLFYANAFVSSTWYLFFSKRVRKCLFKLLEGSFPCIFGRR